MALSGTFQNYPVSSFGLYCEWSGAQSVTANYTDVTLKVYLSYYTLDVGARSDSTISINGVSETYTVPAIEDYSSGWKKKLLKTKTTSSFTNTKGKKGTKYYYKARVLVYDGKTLIAKSELKQASCGVRTWTK